MLLSDYIRPSGSSMSNGVTMDGTEGLSSSFLVPAAFTGRGD